MAADYSRPRGILTPRDRELLRGEIEYEHRQQYSNRYKDIRARIANGLLDFSLIRYALRDRDRKRIFRDPAGESGADSVSLTDSLRAMLSWTYLGLREQNYDFETILVEAIEEAEADFARKYWGESVDITVTYNVETDRSQDIGDLITLIEEGGPVPANRLYNLLQLSRGVPIDISELDVVRVWFDSSYPEGEKAVLETIFSEYLGASVEIEDAEDRVDVVDLDNAVTDDKPRLDPTVVKNHSLPTDVQQKRTMKEIKRKENTRLNKRGNSGYDDGDSPSDQFIDEITDEGNDEPPSIEDLIDNGKLNTKAPTPEAVVELLKTVREPFLSTVDVAAVFDSAVDAASQSLAGAQKDGRVSRQSVRDTAGDHLAVWQLNRTDS